MTRTYGYCRVSSADQTAARQLAAMQTVDVDERFILTDTQSGKDFNRPQYQILKNALRAGDLLVITSIDRLGRNYREIVKEWQDITQNIGADIRVLDMPTLDTTKYKDLLGNFISDLILQVLAYVAEQERANIKSRQEQGISCARAAGKHLGRPKAILPSEFGRLYAAWKSGTITATKAMEDLGLKRTTFYKLVRQHEKDSESIVTEGI